MAFDPTMDPEGFAIQQALAQAAALRKSATPARGQMVSGRGVYVPAPMSAHLLPLVNNLVADKKEQDAMQMGRELNEKQQEALKTWLSGRPQAKTTYGASDVDPTMETVQPTDTDNVAWASQGLTNPMAKGLASKVIEDTIVQAPIRAEKAADKKENTLLVNQRYDEDRKARATLAAQQAANRVDLLRERLDRTDANSLAARQLQRELATEQNALRKYQIDAGIEKADADRDAKLEAAFAKAGGTRGGVKGLSATQLKEVAGFQDAAERQVGFESSFKDDYVGPKAYVAAEVGGTVLTNDPKANEIAQWWRDFRANDNVERHELFGSALTASEKAAWAKTTVTPLSNPAQVRDAIAKRRELAEKAMARRIKLYTEGVPSAAPASAPPAPATNFPRTRVTPAEQSTRDNDARAVLEGERKAAEQRVLDAAPGRERERAQEDLESIERELSRLPGGKKRAAAPAAPPKTVKWSDLK